MTTPTPNAMPGAATPPADPPPVTPPAAVTPPEVPPPAEAPKPPWEADGQKFDPERAWSLITNLRTENAEIKAKTDPIVAAHEAQRLAALSEQDRLKEENGAIAGERDTWRTQAIRAQAEQMATGKFVSTKAAVALIGDLSVYGTPEGVDVPKLQARLDQLAAEEPNLLVPQGPAGFTPNRGQGQSGTGPAPLDAQIKAAQESGNILQSIALKQQKQYGNR